jgi:hypothetical protein
MHDQRNRHLEVAHRILRHLNGSLGRGLWFKANKHLNVEGSFHADWAGSFDDQHLTFVSLLEEIWYVGGAKMQHVISRSTP